MCTQAAKKAVIKYKQLKRNEKMAIIDQMVNHFKAIGQFLVYDTAKTNRYREADDYTIRQTVSHFYIMIGFIRSVPQCLV